MANAMGIPPGEAGKNAVGIPPTSPGLEPITGIALGNATVSPINMANAYATIANEGVYSEPYVVEEVVGADGAVEYTHEDSTERAVGADIAADVSYALQQNVTGGSGTAALALGRPAAGKTGTATNGKGEVSSAWFAGYTPQMSTAVMYVRGKGNEELQGWLPSYFGGAYPADTWLAVMSDLMEGLEVEEFPEPVVRRRRGARRLRTDDRPAGAVEPAADPAVAHEAALADPGAEPHRGADHRGADADADPEPEPDRRLRGAPLRPEQQPVALEQPLPVARSRRRPPRRRPGGGSPTPGQGGGRDDRGVRRASPRPVTHAAPTREDPLAATLSEGRRRAPG